MMHPETYLEARRSAQHHVQVEITAISLPSELPGSATIRARVGTVFRSTAGLSADDSLEFGVSVTRSMDDVPTGAVCWTLAEVLAEGRWLEAFLNGSPPNCEVAAWQSEPIGGPTSRPTMSLTEF